MATPTVSQIWSQDLGRLELPVAISALVWVVGALFVLTVPAEALVPDLIVVGLVVAVGSSSSACSYSTPRRSRPSPSAKPSIHRVNRLAADS
jgi:uncharacterized membrane protein HdeD (DUF308 family)